MPDLSPRTALAAAVVHEDAGNTVRVMTSAAGTLLGLEEPVTAFIERHVAHVHKAIAARCHDPEGYVAGVDRLRRRGAALYDERLTLADGTALTRSYVPLEGDGGTLWIFRSVRELREEDVLGDRLILYEALHRAMPAQIAVFSATGRYEYVSPSAIRNEELRAWIIGKTDREYLAYRNRPPEVAERREAAILAVVSSGAPQQFEETLEAPDGTLRFYRRYNVPLFDEQGVVHRVLGYGSDVTEQRQMELQLQQSQKMEALGRLAGGVAHDFNNLLTVISGCSEALLQELGPDDPGRTLLTPILEAGQRAADLTRQLLAFSRRNVPATQAIDVNELVERMVGLLRRLLGETVTITVTPAPHPLMVRMDPAQLQQVLMNLGVNARDAMPSGGTLHIQVGQTELVRPDLDVGSDHFVELRVRDSGIGMAEEVRQRIFEPFFTTKPVGQGTGLGLSTVYGIVSHAGGSVAVESVPDMGTTFRVLLPMVEDAPAADGGAVSITPPRGSGTILVVDDSPLVRTLVQRELAKLGYRILGAGDGLEALEVAAGHDGPIDLLVSDVVMPRMGGPALAQALRTIRPTTRVLFMSGYADDAALLDVMNALGADFLPKPFAIRDLAERVAARMPVPRGLSEGG